MEVNCSTKVPGLKLLLFGCRDPKVVFREVAIVVVVKAELFSSRVND